MRKRLQLVVTMLLGIFLGMTVTLGFGLYTTSSAAPNYEYLDLFTKVLHFVLNNYVEEVDTKKLIEGAIKGMLSELDPHTVYLPPKQYKEMQVDTSGKFGGLGIEIAITDGYLTVVTPIDDTPAFYSGVEPGDRIVRIEDKKEKLDKETKGMTLQEAVNLMRGKPGTNITIHVVRKGEEKPIPIEIKRDIIKVESVKYGMVEEDYGWVRISNFQSNTTRELVKGLEKLIKENKKPLKGLVLDLRQNPGGLLEEAVSVSGVFVGKKSVVSTQSRSKSHKEIEYAHPAKSFLDFKMVCLVNEASASASEIVAGALQDHKRAVILGKQTFGKGSVQTVIDLDNSAGLKLTVARYFTPNGRSIQSKGITPDIEVERIDVAVLEKARKQKTLREADLRGHILGDEEEKVTSEEKAENGDPDARPVKMKDGRKIRISDPRVLVKTDFQLQQSLSYLKAWGIFEASTELNTPEPERAVSVSTKKTEP